MLFSLISTGWTQTTPDSAKVVMLRIKSSKPDNNWSGNTTAICDFENDLLARASISDFTLTSDKIDSAMLRIFFKLPVAKGDFAFYNMDPNWVDTTVTWNSAASLTVDVTPFATLTVDQDADAHYWLNITDYIKSRLDAGIDFGWRTVSLNGIASATSRTSYHADPNMQPTIFLYEKDVTSVEKNPGIGFSIYPNPATDYLRITLVYNLNGTVNLYNTVGVRVLQKQITSSNIMLDLAAVESGIYFLSVESEETNLQTMKVIVR